MTDSIVADTQTPATDERTDALIARLCAHAIRTPLASRLFKVTTLSGRDDTTGRQRAEHWSEVLDTLSKRKPVRVKDANVAFVPGHWEGGRYDENMRAISMYVGDVDGATQEQVDALISAIVREGVAACLATSWSHGADPLRAKFRVVIPYSRDITPDEHARLWTTIGAEIVGGVHDQKCGNASRLYYAGGVCPEYEDKAETVDIEGAPLDVDRWLARAPAVKAPSHLRLVAPVTSSPVDLTKRLAATAKGRHGVVWETWRRVARGERALRVLGGPGSDDLAISSDDFVTTKLVWTLAREEGWSDVSPEDFATLVWSSFSMLAVDDEAAGNRSYSRDDLGEKWRRALEKLAADRAAVEAEPANGRECFVTGDLSRMVRDAEIVIESIPWIYWRRTPCGAELVRVLREPADDGVLRRDGESPTIASMGAAAVRMALADSASWVRLGGKDGDRKRACAPPKDVVEGLMSRTEFRRPYLEGVTASPILRRDLSVCETAGYDPATRLLYEPRAAFPELRTMTPQEGAAMLLDVVGDFPFKSDAHRAGWIAAVLTVVARAAFEGSAPLFLFDAATPGSGKTLLADLVAWIATGARAAKQGQVKNEEMEKRILSLALSGDAIVLIDNISEVLGGGALELAITANVCQGRTLGKTEMQSMNLRMVWLASGNNVELTNDLQRRVIPIRLVANEERPENRSGFRYPDLEGYVRSNRAALFMAALAVLRAPRASVPMLGSFEDWSRVVRGAMVGAGLPDPIEARREITDQGDPVREARGALFDALAFQTRSGALTARELLAQPTVTGPARELEQGRPGETMTAQGLGYVLRRLRDKVLDGRRLSCATDRNGVARWRVASV